MAKKKTWQEKLLNSKGHPSIMEIGPDMRKRWGGGSFVIPAPIEVDEIMRGVRKGNVITIDDIRKKLAKKHQVDVACPITTGIFAWIAANAADEKEKLGKKRITPYWRILKTGFALNPKYPGGIENLRSRLEQEGHVVEQRRKRYFLKQS
ncbi:MAG: MGMT family protein [Rubripirellula sp.]|nr:MGMT family protein [Rubripirellula sp.]